MQSWNATVYLFNIDEKRVKKLHGHMWSFGSPTADGRDKIDILTVSDEKIEMVFIHTVDFSYIEEDKVIRLFGRYGYDYMILTEDEDDDRKAYEAFVKIIDEECEYHRCSIKDSEENLKKLTEARTVLTVD